MNKLASALGVAALCTIGIVAAGGSASASPNDSASCAGQLSQGATPHGASQAAPGSLGEFVSGLATSAPGAVGGSSSWFASQHGDLWACIPSD